MRISDWSSDVCSSDLAWAGFEPLTARASPFETRCCAALLRVCESIRLSAIWRVVSACFDSCRESPKSKDYQRSEERRVGKEWVSTCRSRWSPYHENKKDSTTQLINNQTKNKNT